MPPRPRRRLRPGIKRALIGVAGLAVVSAGAMGYATSWAAHNVDSIPRFAAGASRLGGASSPAPLTLPTAKAGEDQVFLLFSLGSSGMSAADAKRTGVGKGRASMHDGLTDTIMLAVVHPETKKVGLLSLPRDTWVTQGGRGMKLNAVYETAGPQAFADQVSAITGLPVNHMAAVNFAAFADVTDAVGGLDLTVEKPMRDAKAMLSIPRAGKTHFDGALALAYCRSRHTLTKGADGIWRTDPSASDFGRIRRQQEVLTGLAGKVLTPSGLMGIPDLFKAAKKNLTLDASLTSTELFTLAREMTDAKVVTAPVLGRTGWVGEASVVFVDKDLAHKVARELTVAVSHEGGASSS